MNLNGANIFADNVDYAIYTMNSASAGQYCVILPKSSSGRMNMLVDLHMKNSFDGVSNNTKNKDELIAELKDEYGSVCSSYPNSILVFPMLDNEMLVNSVASEDKQKMFDEVKKIGAITSEIYKKLTDDGVDKNNIDQKIVVVKKDDNDNKFVDWLKGQMPNFVDGMDFAKGNATENVVENPFGSVPGASDAVQPEVAPMSEVAPVPEVAPVSEEVAPEVVPPVGDVFGASVPEVQPEVAPVQESVPASEPAPVQENDIFSSPVEEPKQEAAPVSNNSAAPVAGNDIFGASSPEVQSEVTPAPEVQPEAAPVQESALASEPTPVQNETEPKAVQAEELNGTTTFSPIANPEAQPEVAPVQDSAGPKKNAGFANLLILLVILVGVTIASIELGKYLFSVYGAK